jgi:hypothetical protein
MFLDAKNRLIDIVNKLPLLPKQLLLIKVSFKPEF